MPPKPKAPSTPKSLLTTAQGLRLSDTDHSLKAGSRGPTLMEDFHLREKITHFDHERIPERVVHARGAAAHGTFTAYGNAGAATKAGFLERGRETPVFVRFSTVLGSRGSADTVRDVRGFAVKFYTEEGNFDLVGNNMPVFFIQDGIKFPDIIHAGKPHPDREIPQAQSAHDTFWDFVSLHTEATHHVMWAMSDRGIPRSYRTMEGFGVHTFRLVNASDETCLVKFHWKPVAGVHSLVWEEAQIAAGADPDFHRRDMADGIDNGAPLEFELGVQIMPDSVDQTFEGIDLLDPTKLVPEELCEVQLIGKLSLDRNPTNYFAETEQVAFHTGNLVPGIEVTDDPLMQARMFSYLDTQLTRLGGPNFTQLPINCPHAAVNDNLRDGMHQTLVHDGIAPYLPNSLGTDAEPAPATAKEGGYVHVPREVTGTKVRENPASFADHFSQASLFWASMTEVERVHIIEAFTFELGKCYEQPIRERMLTVLANVDADLCTAVAEGLGLPAPQGKPADAVPSPALSQIIVTPGPIAGRVIGVVAADGADLAGITKLRRAVEAQGAVLRLLAPSGGTIKKARSTQPVERTFLTTRSIEYDAVLVAAGNPALKDIKLTVLLGELFRHCKVIGAWGDGAEVLTAAGIDTSAPGILLADTIGKPYTTELFAALGLHRVWDRAEVIMN
ncbi:catalase [Kribbella sp. NPDC056861]|uniref:catalase n=1 Tax=Kribbella sp. NPDC056861 TaxID=3154857 RepID=UPI003417C21F